MKVSVIIPTFNGENKILKLLFSLEGQTFTDFEIIIVIDGSTDDTKQILNEYAKKHPFIRVVEQTNQGRAIVRNNGVKNASGDLLIFFDDDMTPFETCIEAHIKHHHFYPNSILTGGISENRIACKSDIQHYKAFLSEKWNNIFKKFIGKPLSKENIFITAANFSISKELFLRLNGFDVRLNDVEDYDFAIRAFELNIPLYYDINAFAWHNEEITCQSYVKRQREYYTAYNKLMIINPLLYSKYVARNPNNPNVVKRFVIKIFKNKLWIFLVDNFNWLKIFPKTLRYKIYDIIILANGVYSKKNGNYS